MLLQHPLTLLLALTEALCENSSMKSSDWSDFAGS